LACLGPANARTCQRYCNPLAATDCGTQTCNEHPTADRIDGYYICQ
jgi:hypothetical protein